MANLDQLQSGGQVSQPASARLIRELLATAIPLLEALALHCPVDIL